MTKKSADLSDPSLMQFLKMLVDDESLDDEHEKLARKAIDNGLAGLATSEREILDTEIVAPYVSCCEACSSMPSWQHMLHVYDTGLCNTCFDKLAGINIPDVRPNWMPLIANPVDEDELAIPA